MNVSGHDYLHGSALESVSESEKGIPAAVSTVRPYARFTKQKPHGAQTPAAFSSFTKQDLAND
jgi:hypothetical protein